MRKVTDINNLEGKYVLLRSSLNIPLKDGVVRSHFRLERALPTMRYLSERGAKTIIIGHIGRKPEETLQPIFSELKKYLSITWGGSITDTEFCKRRDLMENGDLLLAENLRQNLGEKSNEEDFVKILENLGEYYVNDAFDAVHREHASTFGIAKKLPAFAGLTLIEEVTELAKVMDPETPSLFLLGGAKFETKMPLVEKYLKLYDQVFIGGALVNDILKAKGIEIGQSTISDVSLAGASFLDSDKLLLPIDVVTDSKRGKQVKSIHDVKSEEKILDCGPETVAMLKGCIKNAKTILWNGPFGAYEAGYTEGTEEVAHIIAEADAFSVIGGGDTVAATEKLGLHDKFNFVSIGGGSMLSFLETGTTSVLETLK